VADYAVKMKPSAERELDRLSGKLDARIVSRLENRLSIHGRRAARNSKAATTSDVSASAITAQCTSSTTASALWK